MTTVLFIWVLSGGQIHLEGIERVYSLEACMVAKRAAENTPLMFKDRPEDIQVRGMCSAKRLPKDKSGNGINMDEQ